VFAVSIKVFIGSCIKLRSNLFGTIERGPGGYSFDVEGEEEEEGAVVILPHWIKSITNIAAVDIPSKTVNESCS